MHMRGIWIRRHGGRDSVVGDVHLAAANVAQPPANGIVTDGAAEYQKGFVARAHVVGLRGGELGRGLKYACLVLPTL